jgi:beta-glucosidase
MAPLLLAVLSVAALATNAPLFKQAGAPIPSRVADLVARMTLDELIAAVAHKDGGSAASIVAAYSNTSVGGVTILVVKGGTALGTVRARNTLQAELMASSRLGIPVSFAHEGLHSGSFFGTIFPMPSLTSCSWNDTLPLLIGAVLGDEARAYGVDNSWSPVVNMWGDSRFGRYQEGFSPDPTITSHMGRGIVLGMQGGPSASTDYLPGGFNSSTWATAKHFAGYGSAGGGLNGDHFLLSNRTLFQQYLRPWRSMAAVGVRGVMPSHNSVLDVPMHLNQYLIRDVLRGEFGFGSGMTVSDCNDIGSAVFFGVVPDDNLTAITALAMKAGVDSDLQCGYDNRTASYIEHVPAAIASGMATLADLQTLAGRYLTQKFAAGLFDQPMTDESWVTRLDSPAHRQLAYEAAAQSIVLLANNNGTLPLAFGTSVTRVALVGALMTCGSGQGATCFGREAMLGSYTLDSGTVAADLIPAALAARFPSLSVTLDEGASPDSLDESGIAAAVTSAQASDVVVVALGDSLSSCGEWLDRDSLDLPGAQLTLLSALVGTGKPVVLVLINGRAASFGPGNAILNSVAAVVEAWRPGEMGAYAIVDIISGAVNPSGKLTNQWAQHVGQMGSGAQPWVQRRVAKWIANTRGPADPTDGRVYDPYTTGVSGAHGAFISQPLFRFGSGLSYTAFTYESISVAIVSHASDLRPFSGRGGQGYRDALATVVLNATVRVCNTGSRSGTEIVQVYSQDPHGAMTLPIVPYWKRLVGYGRIPLDAGACGDLVLPVIGDDLALYDGDMVLRVIPGKYVITAGGRSDLDTLRANVTLT